MSRIRFDLLPAEYTRAKRVLDDSFRSLREVLDGGWRWREQVRGVVTTVIDTAVLPVSIQVAGITSRPLAAMCLSAVEIRTASGIVMSGNAITWEWRNGQLLVHSIDGLAASTRYNVVIAVME